MSATTENRPGDSSGSDAEVFMYDPPAFFDRSYTKQHSIARDRMEELQLAALTLRFHQGLEQVAMVSKLAGRQRITQINEFDDIVPLLFEHTMYKSYPLSLLERQQFDKLTSWVSKLTPIDLSAVDASECNSIDSWLAVLADKAELQITYTSGTSGTMSFLPVSRHDHRVRARVNRAAYLQTFGEPPSPAALDEPVHLIGSANRWHAAQAMRIEVAHGEDAYTHLSPIRPSADLLWLAARLRFAAARGDSARVEVPAALLARRGELEQAQASEPGAIQAWIDEIGRLQGEHVLWQVFPANIYEIAAARLEKGERWSFTPESRVVCQGGSKGRVLPPDWFDTVRSFIEVGRVIQTYGMAELTGLSPLCSAGRYHIQPWVIPFVLDPETSKLLPRQGVQTGRFAFFDLAANSHWGGLMTGDEIALDFDGQCECGATTLHFSSQVSRLSEKRGGDDKISCTATPQAYEEAMGFLVGS
jgi:hypothetical protein